MESSLMLFIGAAIAALAVENAVLARGLGIGREIPFMNSPQTGILMGGLFTWVALWSGLPISLANYLLAGNPNVMIIRAPIYLLSILAVYTATIIVSGRFLKDRAVAAKIRRLLPVSTFNSALFAGFYLSASQNFVFAQTMGYALGAGLGYTAAIFIIYYARKRLAISPVPRSFRGLPILLIYLGLLSLALYGLVGHSLPT